MNPHDDKVDLTQLVKLATLLVPEPQPALRPTLAEAIACVKERADETTDLELVAALDVLVGEFDRMRLALMFYARKDIYDPDGAACSLDEDGLPDRPDKGDIARIALRRGDYIGPVISGQRQLEAVLKEF